MRAIAAATLVIVACQAGGVVTTPTGTPGVSLTTAQSSYQAGTQAELRLANGTSGDLGYNLCHSQLQRLEGGSWVAAQVEGHVCTMELRLLQAGGTATFPYPLPGTLQAGQYRFVTNVERMQTGERAAMFSTAFTVTR